MLFGIAKADVESGEYLLKRLFHLGHNLFSIVEGDILPRQQEPWVALVANAEILKEKRSGQTHIHVQYVSPEKVRKLTGLMPSTCMRTGIIAFAPLQLPKRCDTGVRYSVMRNINSQIDCALIGLQRPVQAFAA